MKYSFVDEKVVNKINASRNRKLDIFRDSEPAQKGFLLLALPKQTAHKIINDLDNREIVDIIGTLDPNKSTRLLHELSSTRARHIIEKLKAEDKEKIDLLLSFSPKTAAGLMGLDYIIASPSMHFSDLSIDLAAHEKATGRFPSIFVVENGSLVGEIPGHILSQHPGSEKVGQYVTRVPHIKYDIDEHKVIDTFLKHPHDKVVVLGDKEDIIGVINSNDLLSLLDKKRASDIYGLAGVSNDEAAMDTVFSKVRHRWLWLILNLGTAFLAASIVGMFEGTIAQITLLAVYMPIVAGMGGNAATQTLAVTVRGIVMHEVSLASCGVFIGREIAAGVINGAINGTVVAHVAILLNKNPMLGFVLAVAMICNLFIAAFAGALIPLIMKKLGKDPATSATILITTCTDVGGFFIFLSLAKVFLT